MSRLKLYRGVIYLFTFFILVFANDDNVHTKTTTPKIYVTPSVENNSPRIVESNYTIDAFNENFSKVYVDKDNNDTNIDSFINTETEQTFSNEHDKSYEISPAHGDATNAEKDSDSILHLVKKNKISHTKVIPLNERHNNTLNTKKQEKYGVSIVWSSDIIALKSVIVNLEQSHCKNDSLALLNSLLLGETWALKMYDASAKSPVGLLYGEMFQLGNFDECITVGHNDESPVKGKYCLANVVLPKHTLPNVQYDKRYGPREDIYWAVCVPSSCPAEFVETFLSTLLTKSSWRGTVSVPADNCHTMHSLIVDKYDVVYLVVVLSFTTFVLICTGYHIWIWRRNKHGYKASPSLITEVLLSFSLARNFRKIFSVKRKSELGLDAIAGLKVLSMILILIGHSTMFIFSGPVANTDFYDEKIQRVQNIFLLGSPLVVDSFLLISSFLFCRLLLLEYDKRKGKVNIIVIYIVRYIRIAPAYLVVVGFYMTWLDKLNDGPMWDMQMSKEKERCLNSWWSNFLFINNYVNTDQMCMFQSWYLSVDTQLFMLAPAIIYPLWRWPKFGEWLLGIVIVIISCVPFVVTYWGGLDPTILPFPKEVFDIAENNDYYRKAYIKTHMRATAYCMGLLCGYLVHKIESKGYEFKSNVVWICWSVAAVCGMSSLFTLLVFINPEYQYDPLSAAVYSALHKVGWSIAIGWVLIACSTKHFHPFDKMFSWKPLIPLCRLTFCAYLVNGLVELHAMGTLRESTYLSLYTMTVLCLSHLIQTFGGSLILCLMFESPIHGFEKMLLRRLVNKNPAERKGNSDETDVVKS